MWMNRVNEKMARDLYEIGPRAIGVRGRAGIGIAEANLGKTRVGHWLIS